jgi:hypothetical protein
MVVFGGVLGMGLSAIQLVNTWASFGYQEQFARYLVAMSFTILVGFIPPYFFGGPAWRFFTWPALAATMTVVVLASLFVIRASGYRLDKIISRS